MPDVDCDRPKPKRFKSYPVGCLHIDVAEVWTEQGTLPLFVAIDRTSKFAYVKLHERASARVSADFLKALIEVASSKIHTVLVRKPTPCPFAE